MGAADGSIRKMKSAMIRPACELFGRGGPGIRVAPEHSDIEMLPLLFERLMAIDCPELGRPCPASSLNGRKVLSVLCYCYARGILETDEISSPATAPAIVQRLCAGEIPSAGQLRAVRRRFRTELKCCLVHLLSHWPSNGRSTAELREDSKYRLTLDSFESREYPVTVETLVEERLRLAALLDTAALDD